MFWIIIIVLVLLGIALPGVWVRQVLARYSEPADRYRNQGSGADLARHLLDVGAKRPPGFYSRGSQ